MRVVNNQTAIAIDTSESSKVGRIRRIRRISPKSSRTVQGPPTVVHAAVDVGARLQQRQTHLLFASSLMTMMIMIQSIEYILVVCCLFRCFEPDLFPKRSQSEHRIATRQQTQKHNACLDSGVEERRRAVVRQLVHLGTVFIVLFFLQREKIEICRKNNKTFSTLG